jgi:hypothetical protein
MQILPTLGYKYNRIEETVAFARPAELVAAIELAVYRNRDEEGGQLKVKLWASTLATEGRGDPAQYHRWVLLTARKLEALFGEAVRDSELRAIFTKGLPDDIFLDFKTSLQINVSIKTFDEVNEALKIFAASDTHSPKVNALIRLCERQYVKPVPAGVFLAQPVAHQIPRAQPNQVACNDFIKGKCTRGDGCRFLHSHAAKVAQASTVAAVVCTHCSKKGHSVDTCFTKYPDKRPSRMRVKQGVAAARPARPNAARAANFLLNIRQNVEDMLLETEEQDGRAEVFTFRVLADDSVFPPLPTRSQIRAANADSAVGVNSFSSVNHSLVQCPRPDVPALLTEWSAIEKREARALIGAALFCLPPARRRMCEADVDSKHDDYDHDTNVGAECLSPVNHMATRKDVAISLSHCPPLVVPALLADSSPLGRSLKRARAKVAAREFC